jgi:hypothetical protein
MIRTLNRLGGNYLVRPLSEQVTFLSLDMNTRDPEIAAAEYSGTSW